MVFKWHHAFLSWDWLSNKSDAMTLSGDSPELWDKRLSLKNDPSVDIFPATNIYSFSLIVIHVKYSTVWQSIMERSRLTVRTAPKQWQTWGDKKPDGDNQSSSKVFINISVRKLLPLLPEVQYCLENLNLTLIHYGIVKKWTTGDFSK